MSFGFVRFVVFGIYMLWITVVRPTNCLTQVENQTLSSSAKLQRSAVSSESRAEVAAVATEEDLTCLSLLGSKLTADSLMVEKDEYPSFTREFVRIQWRKDDPIDLFVLLPKGVKHPPVVLYLYGYPSETSRYWNEDFDTLVTGHGFAAIGFVSALTGQRYHDRPLKEWFVSQLQESIVSSVHDVQLTLNYLAQRGDVDMNRVGMFGEGSGGTIAILAAGVDSRIKALDLLDPWGDWQNWMASSTLIPAAERPTFLKPEFLKQIAPLDTVALFPKLRTPSVRLQLVATEPVTPQIVQQHIAASAPPQTQLVNYADAKAFMAGPISTGAAFDWIKGALRALP